MRSAIEMDKYNTIQYNISLEAKNAGIACTLDNSWNRSLPLICFVGNYCSKCLH